MTLPAAVNPTVNPPHLAFPFALAGDGSIAVVDQDSIDDIAGCVRVLLATVTGTRVTVPDYGIPDPTFAGVDPAVIAAAVARWEPRAQVDVTVDGAGAVTVTVRPAGS